MSCLSPLIIKGLSVPCGHCKGCKSDLRNEWVSRLILESLDLSNKYQYFLTLTYNDDNLPEHVNKRDVQLFLKRLRKRLNTNNTDKSLKVRLRYFCHSEYGSKNLRPHYHFILYSNYPINNDDISSTWKFGFFKLGFVSVKAIQYVSKYINKFSYDDGKFISHSDFKKEFRLMSKVPSLGFNYFVNNFYDLFKSRETSFFMYEGKRYKFPKYAEFVDSLDLLPISKKVQAYKHYIDLYDKFKKSDDLKKSFADFESFYNSSIFNYYMNRQNTKEHL